MKKLLAALTPFLILVLLFSCRNASEESIYPQESDESQASDTSYTEPAGTVFTETEYDENGNIIRTLEGVRGDGGIERFYSADGILIEELTAYSDGREEETLFYSGGNVYTYTLKNADGTSLTTEYREDGTKAYITNCNTDGSKSIIAFDQTETKISLTVKYTDGSETETRFYENGSTLSVTKLYANGAYDVKKFGEDGTVTEDISVDTNGNMVNNLSPSAQSLTDTNITDADALEIISQIAEIARKYGLAVSYKFGDYYYSYNGSKSFASASTIKAVYCQYLLESGADLEEEVVFETDYVRNSTSGMLTEEHKGEVFTVGELIEYTIQYSDNMAYRLLFSKYGYDGFNEYVTELGLPGLRFYSNHEFNNLCASDLTKAMWHIYEYSDTDSTLVEHLINTKHKKQIALGTGYKVAAKYGYNFGTNGYHDTAIVFAPEPYVLSVLSHIDRDGNSASSEPFIEVTRLTDALHAILSEEAES